MEPCTQDGQCPPPTGSLCSCDSISDCPDGIDKILPNCSSQSCPAGELRCLLGNTCIPHTWFCDGHPDCPDSRDELGCGTETLQEGTSVGTPVTPVILESVTYLGNATATFVRDQDSVQSGNRNAYGVIAAAGAPVPAGAAGGHQGVLTDVREEDLTALRMSSCHHATGALSGRYEDTHMAVGTPALRYEFFWPHSTTDLTPADLILETGDA
uniref:CD320 molecule n=1 Tax=Molossus molossus TaxID=27622 RepID=A0A7J8I526_MOLMO|nr:CD320 molecule [Molossus molossus]